MADHWKSLANRLGTPGIDEPEPETTEDTAPEAQSSATEAPHADIESSPVMETPPSNPPPERKSEESGAATLKPDDKPAKKEPKKRKSSWETLANLFNISVEREESESEEVAEADSSDSQDTEPTQAPPKAESPPPAAELAIFDEPESEDNPALEAMFGDAPRTKDTKTRNDRDGWGKPKRVVDDLGWDDDEPSVTDDEDVLPTATSDESEINDEASDESDAPRRGRRRRRRGRRGGRGRDEETSKSDEAPAETKSSGPTSWKVDDVDVDVESSDDWPEPDSFELEDSVETADSSPSNRSGGPDVDEEGEVVRRSNRRRRGRGRGRGRSSEEGPAAPTPREDTRDRVTARARDLDSDEDRDDDSEDAPSTPEGRRAPEESRGRRRRRPRSSEAPKRGPGPDADVDADADSDSADDLPEQQHRNIPTWNDSLESIIQANTENHKRNEGRGGSRGGSRGGRGRGRR